jgi:hypothetical protein
LHRGGKQCIFIKTPPRKRQNPKRPQSRPEDAMPEQRKEFKDKSQIEALYLDNMEAAYDSLNSESNPNHFRKISTDDYLKSVEELAEPFSKAVQAIYA